MKYLENLVFKFYIWIADKAYASSPLSQTDYGVVSIEVPVQKDIFYYLDWYFEYIVVGFLMIVAIGVVLWYKFRKKKVVNNKENETS